MKVLFGAGLVAWFWALFAVIAFVPFGRDDPALLILAVAATLFIATVVFLARRRLADLETGGYVLLTLGVLVALYSIPLRDDLPDEALALNDDISQRHEDRYAYAFELFEDLSQRFTGPTREYALQPLRVFVIKSAAYYWKTEGYVPSHLQAQLYRHMLLASSRFDDDEVEYRTGRCFNSPHGFVAIAHPDRIVYADLWAAQSLDEYRFGQVVDMPSCDGVAAESEPEGQPFVPD
jgi:hypothetical protein